jgi:hypothetical protein
MPLDRVAGQSFAALADQANGRRRRSCIWPFPQPDKRAIFEGEGRTMKTSVIFGLLLIFVMPTTTPAQSPLPKEESGTMDAGITEEGSIGAAPFGSPISDGG